MVPSELTRRAGMGELLVLLVCWKLGPYGVPDQEGDRVVAPSKWPPSGPCLGGQFDCAPVHYVMLSTIIDVRCCFGDKK